MSFTVNEVDISFTIANTDEEFADARNLFNEYANSLNFNLCFQDFEKELATINEQYNKPRGALLLASNIKVAIGCAGIREYDKDTAELKRMYVKPDFRKHKIGMKMLELAIEVATDLKYKKIRLDTVPSMVQAQNLYRSFGFYEIESYRYNPVNGTIYMEKILT